MKVLCYSELRVNTNLSFPILRASEAFKRNARSVYFIDRIIFNISPIQKKILKEFAFVKQYKSIRKISEFERYRFSTNYLETFSRYLFFYFLQNPLPLYKAYKKFIEVEEVFDFYYIKTKEDYKTIKNYIVNSYYLEDLILFVAYFNEDARFAYKYYKEINAFVISNEIKRNTKKFLISLNTKRVLFHSRHYWAKKFF